MEESADEENVNTGTYFDDGMDDVIDIVAEEFDTQ